MNAWDISASLVRVVILVVATISILLLRRWVGGRWRTYLAIIGGMLFLGGAEALHLIQLSRTGNLGVSSIAWDSVYIHAAGYLGIALGLLLWVRDFRERRRRLELDNMQLHHAAMTDFLTELLNRREASLHFRREMARALRNKSPLGFIMIDLDHFKDVNDTFGHQAGDAVLAHIAGLLRNRVRESDIVVRYGGEEFLVVAVEADLPATVGLAETLRRLIEDRPAEYGGRTIPVRASFGVAMLRHHQDTSVKEIIERADKACYTAKAQGRNRVVADAQLENQSAAAADPARDQASVPSC